MTHLWDEEAGRFARGLIQKDNRWVKDMTLESSMFGIFEFGVLPVDDYRVVRTMNAIKEGLSSQNWSWRNCPLYKRLLLPAIRRH